jgi:hypothetical protein
MEIPTYPDEDVSKEQLSASHLALELKCVRLKLKELTDLGKARDALRVLVEIGYLTREESAAVFLGTHRVLEDRRPQGGETAWAIAQDVASKAKSSP